ncbi:MFS general substrate transporter [Sistotremastrum niveocremeum HHB9708]|uniref:MFS general substrate transporter n=1 Tax=Sistotremastrum niveocremeum HHB9708 TaxID=1314777 RepID=A0A165AIH8_9AGAM|nr:MFS general substrate transporter [Sistotremastrum niveocremeum HHB9708]
MAHSTDEYATRWVSRRVGLTLTCLSIGANALTAGGIFTFPIMSQGLAIHLKLSQPQLTTIVLAGMVGQYPAAAGVGYIVDQYGPWLCSLISAALFSLGFGLFSREIARVPSDTIDTPPFCFESLVFFFLLCGLGTVNSYFSTLFAATKNFPQYSGLAAGLSMSIFGLSPLFLSLIAGKFFVAPGDTLDITRYTCFLAILTGCVHIIGACNLRVYPVLDAEQIIEPRTPDTPTDEETLLIPKSNVCADPKTPLPAVLADINFWVLGAVIAVTIGTSEMVLSNIGTVVLSLPPSVASIPFSQPSSPVAATAIQVRLLSLSNTISRVVVGSLADWISPVGAAVRPRRHHVSRLTFLCFFSLLLAFTYLYTASLVKQQSDLTLVSLGVGTSYGAVFTVLPSFVTAFWGLTNLGRNYGVLSYAPFFFTPVFSYLYAFVSAAHAPAHGVCTGVSCWRLTFQICSAACFGATIASLILWKRWRRRA